MQFIAHTATGSRPNNQDAYYADERLFIVCDGVGGVAYGDVASKLACSSFADYFRENAFPLYDCDYLNKALQYTIDKFRETENQHYEMKGMATTVVLIAFDTDGAIVSWMGDSRLYHIRNGQIVFATEDHSLVNDLRKQGNTDEAHLRTLRNIITRSLNAKGESEFSFHGIAKNEIKPGDYFLLCTDGVLENMTDEKICRLFSWDLSLENIKEEIIKVCEGKTRDNFTFEIIQTP